MRYHELIIEAGLPAAGNITSDKVDDLRKPGKFLDFEKKPLIPQVCLTKDGRAIVYYWGDDNSVPWKDVIDRVHSEKDPVLGTGNYPVVAYKNGYSIERSRELAQWSGDRNKYSRDIVQFAQALLNVGLADESTPIYVGTLGTKRGPVELVGKVGAILGNADQQPSRLTLYHGTSSIRAAIIMKHGLKPMEFEQRVWNKGGLEKERPEHREDSVYLTASLEQAEYYAKKAVKIDRVRLGPKVQRDARTKMYNLPNEINTLKGTIDNFESLTPEQVAARDAHTEKYGSWRDPKTAESIVYMKKRVAELESMLEKAKLAASIDQDGPIKPVIFQVTLGRADMRKLMADDDHLALDKDADPKDWFHSLSQFSQVAYQGTIPPSRIKIRKA